MQISCMKTLAPSSQNLSWFVFEKGRKVSGLTGRSSASCSSRAVIGPLLALTRSIPSRPPRSSSKATFDNRLSSSLVGLSLSRKTARLISVQKRSRNSASGAHTTDGSTPRMKKPIRLLSDSGSVWVFRAHSSMNRSFSMFNTKWRRSWNSEGHRRCRKSILETIKSACLSHSICCHRAVFVDDASISALEAQSKHDTLEMV